MTFKRLGSGESSAAPGAVDSVGCDQPGSLHDGGSRPSRSTLRNAIMAILTGHLGVACTCSSEDESAPPLTTAPPVQSAFTAPAPVQLFLPDASTAELPAVVAGAGHPQRRACPPEMVNVRGSFCIDRFEANLVDVKGQRSVSPYYHPNVVHTAANYKRWLELRFSMGEPEYQNVPVPVPPLFQMRENFKVMARSEPGRTPQGYMSGLRAEEACANAGKRLCSEEEWVTACMGAAEQQFPYGRFYESGKCNVHLGVHPAAILHGKASLGHLDPRMNYFRVNGRALLHETGSHPECASRWGEDAVYDMVGNIDEWIADPEGVFLGGFYSRNTKDGCLSKISAHPRPYFDYSLGVRCCL